MSRKVINDVAWMSAATEVESISADELTELRFVRDYVNENRPLIIRNAVAHWPAMRKWQDKNYLMGICPGQKAYFYPHANYMETKRQQVGEQIIPFAEGVDRLESATSGVLSMLLTINKPFSSAVGLFSELLPDFDGFSFLGSQKASDRFADMRAFFYRGAETSWHHHYCDETLLCQIRGAKTIGLLYADNRAQRTVGKRLADEVYLDDSRAFEVADAAKLRPLIAEIREGDALYIPAFWWHGVSPVCHDTFGISVAKTWRTPAHLLGNFMLPGPRILWWLSLKSFDRLALLMPLMAVNTVFRKAVRAVLPRPQRT